MEINFVRKENISYLVIDNFFSPEELVEVTMEAKEIRRFALSPKDTDTASDGSGGFLKTGTGIFIDDLYQANRSASGILNYFQKIFSLDFYKETVKFDVIFNFLKIASHDRTLVNYYNQGEVYSAHVDNACLTAICFLRDGEFTGGTFCFPQQNVELESRHNRVVIFPSCALHKTTPMVGDGTRISVAKLISFKGIDH